MKWMIASDIHGSALYCEKMLQAFVREGAQRLLLLGDLLYHGPRNDLPDRYEPREVIRLLNESPIVPLCVRGNCDAEVDQMVLQFPIMADYALLPLDGAEDEEGEVYLYRYSEVDGQPELDNIQDDDEYEAAADAFDEFLDGQEYDELVSEEDLDDL